VEEVLPFVVKKDLRREMYDRQKLLGGIRKACDKRPVPLDRIEATVDQLERELIDSGEKEVTSEALGARVMNHLRKLDEIAYVRFASVYRRFRDLEEFREELDALERARKESP
jgi:transcriptional repressor NrdR